MTKIEKLSSEFIDAFGISDDEILNALARETSLTQLHPRMLSGLYQGNLLNLIVKLVNAKSILEIGTYSGYSAICMARALPEDGKLITLEINDEIDWLSAKYFQMAGLSHKIEAITGDALEIIPILDAEFDLVFIDADKREYLNYYNLVFPKVKSGGLIIADNVLWDNKIFMPVDSNDHMTKGIIEFNEFIRIDKRVEKIILPIRDGLMLVRKV
jgi:predicted O-methyltransferase YrrM